MTDYRVRRCFHEGFTIVKLPPDIDPRDGHGHDMRFAFKRIQARKWLRSVLALRRNVIRFGGAAKN